MTSATALHLRLLECCCAATIPRTSISKPSCPSLSLRQINISHSSIQLKSNNFPSRIVPFVTSDEGVAATAFDSTEFESGEENVAEGDGAEESQLSEDAKLFVGNLPYDIDSEKLAQLFEKAGVVEISEVIYNRQTDQSRGFGFVTMSTVEEADKAVEIFSGYDIGGRILTVNKAAPKGSRPERVVRTYEPSFRMYVGNLPWQVDSDRLVELFSEYGKVVDAKVVFDRDTGRSRGFGFVTMATETELNDAIAALDGESLDGRPLRVNVAEERPRRDF